MITEQQVNVTATVSPSPPSKMVEPSTQTPQPLKFSVENILDPNKFTGHPIVLPTAASRNNNIFQHHLFSQHHPHHPWLLPVVNPGFFHQHHQHHHSVDLHSTSVDSVNEEDSLYDRSSDLESGIILGIWIFV